MNWAKYSDTATEDFFKHHVFVGNAKHAKSREGVVYIRRISDPDDVLHGRRGATNTVLVMGDDEIRKLVKEVNQKQDLYRESPKGEFTTSDKYPYWQRTGKRAKLMKPARFAYGVCMNGDRYVINHYGKIV